MDTIEGANLSLKSSLRASAVYMNARFKEDALKKYEEFIEGNIGDRFRGAMKEARRFNIEIIDSKEERVVLADMLDRKQGARYTGSSMFSQPYYDDKDIGTINIANRQKGISCRIGLRKE